MKPKPQNESLIWLLIVWALFALLILPKPAHGQSRDTIPGNHTGYFEGRTLIYTCSHPSQHGPAWRLNTPPCQPVAVKIPGHVERRRKANNR